MSEEEREVQHKRFMKRALVLARRGRGRVSPNPLVGAVVARNGRIIGEGYHLYRNKDHAEQVALRQAGARARGASLYVTLEPCVHQGRTSPCVSRLIEAGVGQVFVAVRDPNPLVKGRGIRELRKHGIVVHEGLCGQEASRLNEKFFHFIRTRKPFVLLKLALTLDGKIATANGESQWITGTGARKEVQRLRYEYDAVLVGRGTVRKDDPSLTVRWSRKNGITKVVLDSQLAISQRAKLFQSGDPVIVFHGHRAARARIKILQARACLIPVKRVQGLLAWDQILDELRGRGIGSLVIEGGGRVAASALGAAVVDKISFFYGPKILGSGGLPGVASLAIKKLGQALTVSGLRLRQLPPDFVVEAYLQKPSSPHLYGPAHIKKGGQ